MSLIIVVPDGILNDQKTTPTISNTYKAALDLAINQATSSSSKIVLLPANSFGTSKNEQDYAEEYLIKKHINKNFILKGISNSESYISTRQNFLLVMRHGVYNCGNKKIIRINNEIQKGIYTLISSHLHIDRVLIILKHFNWIKPKKILVSYAEESTYITSRLIYYRFPGFRMLYEMLTIFAIEIEFKIKSITKFKNQEKKTYTSK